MSRAVPQEPVTVTCASSGAVEAVQKAGEGQDVLPCAEGAVLRAVQQTDAGLALCQQAAPHRLAAGDAGQMRWASSSSGGSPQSWGWSS